MKKLTAFALILFSIFLISCDNKKETKINPFNDEVDYYSKLDGKYFSLYDGTNWNDLFLKGVNLGAAKPGSFPGELAISKEEYLRWFKQIEEMNANTIRVYTILEPEFYEALYEHNKNSEKPLYLFHGVWIDEGDISNILDAHDPKIKEKFKSDIRDLIDIIHGNGEIEKKAGHAGGKYKYDVSPYIIGWILGIEWDPEFVLNTDDKNKNIKEFKGEYLYTKDASPFESFLCEIGEETIKYETEKYNMQRPLSFTNWVTTDMLKHPNEPLYKEDMATVNTEHIKQKDKFKPGMFAMYHIYPYYPDSMNYQKEYIEYVDDKGNVNTYKAYLEDLIKEHTVPVLVGEFGVPSARGMAHKNIHTGFNQGNIDEETQGKMNSSMLKDIYDTGYAGGIVFSWQDEWFKRTWNNMEYDLPDRRAYWSNPQTNEQQFGLLAFDPGAEESVSYVDGEIDEWKRRTPFKETESMSMYVNSDEKYLYIMLKANDEDFNFENNRIVLPVDITPKSGSDIFDGINFNRKADFIIDINGKDKSKVLVNSYYDTFYYLYSKNLGMIPRNSKFEVPDSKIFNPIYLCLNKELKLPVDKRVIPFDKYETGVLKFGNGNPKSDKYNSLSDFYINNNILEIKIPWQLLNIMDPSTKKAIDDLYKNGIKEVEFENIYIGAYTTENDDIRMDMDAYTWANWDTPVYHERLKKSYYIMQEAMKNIG